MSSGRRVGRVLLFTFGGLAVAGAGLWFAGPSLAEGWVRGKIEAEIAQRGLPITFDDLDLSATQGVLTGVCLRWTAADPEPVSCIDSVTVDITRPGFFSTDITVSRIAVAGGWLDLTAAQGTPDEIQARAEALMAQIRPPRDPDAPPRADAGPRRERPMPDVHVEGFEVRLQDRGLPLRTVTLTSADLARDAESGLTAQAAIAIGGLVMPPFSGLDVADVWNISAHVPDEGAWSVSVRPQRPVAARGFGATDGFVASVGAVSFQYPYTFGFEAIEVRVPGQTEPLLSVPTASLGLRELTTDLEALYFSELELVQPVVNVTMGPAGLPAFLSQGGGPDEGSGTAPAEPSDDGAAEGSADTEGSAGEPNEGSAQPPAADADAEEGMWADREWWEKIPQRIALAGAQVHVRNADGSHGFSLTEASVEYALRIINFQIDVEVRGQLAALGGSATPLELDAVYGWQSKNLRLTLNATDVPLGDVLALAGVDGAGLAGTTDVQLRIDEAERGPGFEFEGSVAVDNLTIPTPLLRSPLVLDSATYTWAASRTEEAPDALRFTVGDGTINGARFTFRPAFFEFNYQRRRPFSRVEFEVDVPEQDANTLFQAIPAALRGPLDGTVLGGTWGYHLEYGFDVEVDPDGWIRPVELDETEGLVVQDENLSLVSLPEAVDVRRMNGPFSFVFRGPEDRFNRPFSVPGPRDDADTTPLPGDWVRLTNISYYLIAMQLYREDGRFFENYGINWFQMRRVIEEAFAERRLGRGASTITMQTIKNVFLSHERSLERKMAELFLTYWVTRLVPKERILEVYLNIIEWGPNINGVAEASRYYFGKTPSELSFAEATWLSAITPAPARRAPQRDAGTPPEWMVRQCHDLMRGLHERGFVTRAELEAGLAEEIRFVTHPLHGQAAAVGAGVEAAPAEEGSALGPDAVALIPVAAIEEVEAETLTGLLALPLTERTRLLIARSIALRPTP